MIDPFRHFGAVAREVGRRKHEGRDCRVVTLSRIYDTTPQDLWNALTSPERIPRWFLPVSGELRLGGKYQFEGNAGGTISVCEPPNRLAATWEFGGAVSWVIVRLQAEDGGTRLTLEHLAEPGDETWTKFGPGAVGVGWDLTFLGLGQHIEGAPAVGPREAMAWSASEEGKVFARRCAEDWGRAAILAGGDATSATAQAARTAAAYTGETVD